MTASYRRGIVEHPTPVRLAFSVAPGDEQMRQELEAHLAPLQREGLLSLGRQPGHRSASPREQHWWVTEAQVVLLLLSKSFMTTEQCWRVELEWALTLARVGLCEVIPILLRPVDWQASQLAGLQLLPRNLVPIDVSPSRDQAYVDIVRELRGVITRRTCTGRPTRWAVRVRASGLPCEVLCSFGEWAEIGRGSDCTFPLRRAPRMLSQRHARLIHLAGGLGYAIHDLSSRHGTWLAGERVLAAKISTGAQISLGRSLSFMFQDDEYGGGLSYLDSSGQALSRYVLVPGGEIVVGAAGRRVTGIPGYRSGQDELPALRIEARTDGCHIEPWPAPMGAANSSQVLRHEQSCRVVNLIVEASLR